MSTNPRLQIILRPWGDGTLLSGRSSASNGWQGASGPSMSMALAAGVLEVDAGTLQGDDNLMPFMLTSGGPGKDFWVANCGRPEAPPEDERDELATSDLGRAMTMGMWRLPTALSTRRASGTLLARRCALPAAPGRETFLLFGPVLGDLPAFGLVAPASHDDRAAFSGNGCRLMQGGGSLMTADMSYAGLVGARLDPHPSRPALVPPLGNNAAAIFRLPNWGWGEEAMSFPSTMAPEACAALDRWNQLNDIKNSGEALTVSEQDEMKNIGYGYGFGGNDPDYVVCRRVVRRFLIARGSEMLPSSTPRTASQLARENETMRAAVGAIFTTNWRGRTDGDDVLLAAIEAHLAPPPETAPGPRR